MIQYSIILVNYKSTDLLLNCLKTIPAKDAGQYEIIVVDNASNDNGKSRVIALFPSVKWIEMGYNSGFARANNAGMRAATGNVFLLLNTDTLIIENAIGECYNRLQQSNHIAAGVQLLNPDGTTQISGNFFMKGGINHLLALPALGQVLRRLGILMKVKKTHVPEASTEEIVDWINGAFLMVKREAAEKAGLLDEDFFLFSEEIEWCYRLGKQGTMVIYGDLRVTHLMGGTVTQTYNTKNRGYNQLSDRKGLQLIVSGWLRIKKQFGTGWLLFHTVAYWTSIVCFFLICLLPGRHYGQRWMTFFGFTGNVVRATCLLPRIIYGKPYFYKII